jgi:hypothetical protein
VDQSWLTKGLQPIAVTEGCDADRLTQGRGNRISELILEA